MKKFKVIQLVLLIVLGIIAADIYFDGKKEEEVIGQFKTEAVELCYDYEYDIERSSGSHDFVENYHLGDLGYVLLLDENLDVLYHPLEELRGLNINALAGDIFNETFNTLSKDNNYIFLIYELDGKEKMILFYLTSDDKIMAITGDSTKHY